MFHLGEWNINFPAISKQGLNLNPLFPNQSINRFGNAKENHGNKVTKISTKKLTKRKGSPALLTSPMEIFPILDATKRQTPTGGVVNPIIKFKTAITAK